ncbi:ATP-binding protein [Methylobrevis pamukkalensis]
MPAPLVRGWRALARAVNRQMPKSLFGRSMLIIVLPMVILLAVLAQVFIDRHYELVTRRLSDAVGREVASLVDLIKAAPDDAAIATVDRVATTRLSMTVSFQQGVTFGPPPDPGFSSLLDRTLASSLTRHIAEPVRIDTTSYGSLVEIRVLLRDGLLRIMVPRNFAYASNSHIFIVWMVVTALVLIIISIIFLRNQIRPIQRLAQAAEMVGRGQPPPKDFAPSGAREVRQAAHAFIEMRRRIERQVEQRTTMLAGVSHDLRTILTRFRLELEMLPPGEETEAMRGDVDIMQAMLEAYLAFAQGVADEASVLSDVGDLLGDIEAMMQRAGRIVTVDCPPELAAHLRPLAFRRMIGNLVGNAARFGSRVTVTAARQGDWLTVTVDDDGPGIPEAEREAVFRPFHRLDDARNQDVAGSGLGLAIARDIALSHGGDIRLLSSPIGGLRAQVRLPV